MKQLDMGVSTLVQSVHEAASKQLAREPIALDVRKVTSLCDVIYICHGESGRAVEAIAEAIRGALKAGGEVRAEGWSGQQWILLDAGDIMVHVFLRDRRTYYGLERLWHDGRQLELDGA